MTVLQNKSQMQSPSKSFVFENNSAPWAKALEKQFTIILLYVFT